MKNKVIKAFKVETKSQMNVLNKILLCLIFILPLRADLMNVDLMGFFTSQSIYRGAQTWPKPSFIIAPGLLFLNRRLKVYGPAISYSLIPAQDAIFTFDVGTRYYDDNKPLIRLESHIEDYRNQRRTSFEANIKSSLKFGKKNKFKIGTFLAKEIHRHKGLYTELDFQVPVLPLTSIVSKVSFASKQASQYIHGPLAKSGAGFTSLSLNFVIPFVPWDGIIINTLTQSWIIQKQNKNADYIRGNDSHFSFSTRWIWKAF